MRYKEQYLNKVNTDKVKNWINVNLENYLKKNEENLTEIEHILDFLESDKAPKRIKYMSYEEAKNGAEKWVKTMIKKAQDICETEEDTKTFIKYKNGVQWVELIGKNAFQREGKLMSHCVSSYHGKSDVKILSLRDIKNNPHCTVEITENNGSINQIKGKGNGSIHPRYIKYVLDLMKKLNVEVRSSEMSNLGYLELSNKLWKALNKDEIKGLKHLTVHGKKYFYKYSKLEGLNNV